MKRKSMNETDTKRPLGIVKKLIDGKNAVILAVFAVGIILLTVSNGSTETANTEKTGADELAAYAEKLEENLAEIISDIEGTGKASVMITFDSSFENIYAYNAGIKGGTASDTRTSEKELVLIGGSRNPESPVLVKKLCPKVKGVLVVCRGGNDAVVKEKITDAASALFGVPKGRVEVIGKEPDGGA